MCPFEKQLAQVCETGEISKSLTVHLRQVIGMYLSVLNNYMYALEQIEGKWLQNQTIFPNIWIGVHI